MEKSTSERWLPVLGFQDTYEVSDQGRVRSLPRWSKSRYPTPWLRPGRVLKPNQGNRYSQVKLHADGKKANLLVHVLVLEAFVGPRPGRAQANHVNGNRRDNRLANLEWVSPSANVRHSWDTGLSQPIRGSRHCNAKLTEQQALEVFHAKGKQRDIARRFGVSQTAVWQIKAKRYWKHIHSEPSP